MGLSAWGAGRRIENHQRERKTSFQRLKKRFGNQMEEIHNPFKIKKTASIQYDEIEALKNRKRRSRRILQKVRDVISLLFLIFIFWLLYVYIFRGS